CVIEVKARLTSQSFKDAFKKLNELAPLVANTDRDEERYKQFLPRKFKTYCVFFECLRKANILSYWLALAYSSPRSCPSEVFVLRLMNNCNSGPAMIRLSKSTSRERGSMGTDGNFYEAIVLIGVRYFQVF